MSSKTKRIVLALISMTIAINLSAATLNADYKVCIQRCQILEATCKNNCPNFGSGAAECFDNCEAIGEACVFKLCRQPVNLQSMPYH